jgi:transposase-like protein
LGAADAFVDLTQMGDDDERMVARILPHVDSEAGRRRLRIDRWRGRTRHEGTMKGRKRDPKAPQHRRPHSSELEADAVGRVKGGATLASVARTLGVSSSTVRNWVRRANERQTAVSNDLPSAHRLVVLDPESGHLLPSATYVAEVHEERAFDANVALLEGLGRRDSRDEAASRLSELEAKLRRLKSATSLDPAVRNRLQQKCEQQILEVRRSSGLSSSLAYSLRQSSDIEFESIDPELQPLAGLSPTEIRERIDSMDTDRAARVRTAIAQMRDDEPTYAVEHASRHVLEWLQSNGAKRVSTGTALGGAAGPTVAELWQLRSIHFIVFETGNGSEPGFINVIACQDPNTGGADSVIVARELGIELEAGRASRIFDGETGFICLRESDEPFRFVAG